MTVRLLSLAVKARMAEEWTLTVESLARQHREAELSQAGERCRQYCSELLVTVLDLLKRPPQTPPQPLWATEPEPTRLLIAALEAVLPLAERVDAQRPGARVPILSRETDIEPSVEVAPLLALLVALLRSESGEADPLNA